MKDIIVKLKVTHSYTSRILFTTIEKILDHLCRTVPVVDTVLKSAYATTTQDFAGNVEVQYSISGDIIRCSVKMGDGTGDASILVKLDTHPYFDKRYLYVYCIDNDKVIAKISLNRKHLHDSKLLEITVPDTVDKYTIHKLLVECDKKINEVGIHHE